MGPRWIVPVAAGNGAHQDEALKSALLTEPLKWDLYFYRFGPGPTIHSQYKMFQRF